MYFNLSLKNSHIIYIYIYYEMTVNKYSQLNSSVYVYVSRKKRHRVFIFSIFINKL